MLHVYEYFSLTSEINLHNGLVVLHCDVFSRFIGPVEVRRAMKALGFRVNREQAKQMVHDSSCSKPGYVKCSNTYTVVALDLSI